MTAAAKRVASVARSACHPSVVAFRKKLASLEALSSSVESFSQEADRVLKEVRTPVPPPLPKTDACPPEALVTCHPDDLVFDEEEGTTSRLFFPDHPPRP